MRKYIFLLFALTAFFTLSCDKEPSFADGSAAGRDVELSLEISSGVMPQVIVKSGWEDNSSAESAVYNLRVYVFSAEDGSLVGYRLFNSSELSFAAGSSPYEKTASLSGIKAKTGQVYIYAIANSTTSQYWADGTGIAKILDVVDISNAGFTRTDFLKAYTTRQEGGFNPLDNVFMMTGYVNGGNPVTISLKEGRGNYGEITSPSDADARMLKLYKVVSKNTFEVKVDNSNGENITFSPDYYAVYNVPQGYGLLPKLPADDEGYRPSAAAFENFTRIVSTSMETTFYLPENLQSGNIKNREALTDFKAREANTYGEGNASPKSFVNAPESSTYFVIQGRYISSHYAGVVSYMVHLGDFSKDVTDFDVTRNYSYKYTITIKGASEFVAECEKSGDDPGSEGTLVDVTQGYVYQLDAHYESRVMKLEKVETDNIINEAGGLFFRVATAFCNGKQLLVKDDGVYDFTSATKDKLCDFGEDGQPVDLTKLYNSGEADFNWVHFVKNTEAGKVDGRDISDVCKYPGTANTKNVFQILSDIYKSEKEGGTDDFFDVYEDGKRVAYVSVFVDENYYPEKAWTEYVNKTTPRVMYLSSVSYNVSKDGRSSYTNPKFVLAQRSIWTFYDSSVDLPFGIETVSEENEYMQTHTDFAFVYSTKNGNFINSDVSSINGYDLAVRYATDASYQYDPSYYSDGTYIQGKQDIYKNALKACNSRNRDENGNGTIDADEVKWYLPTIRDLCGVAIGEPILPSETSLLDLRMFEWKDLKNDNVNRFHYVTTTRAKNAFQMLWAEEGGTNGNVSSDAKQLRCIRTLENPENDRGGNGQQNHEPYVSSEKNNETGMRDIILHMAAGALRSYTDVALAPSYERGEASTNFVFSAFQVDASNLNYNGKVDFSMAEIVNSGAGTPFINSVDDVCRKAKGGSWRVPNQKELMLMNFIMNSEILLEGGNYRPIAWSSTAYNGGANPSWYRPGRGFIMNKDQMVTCGWDSSAGNNPKSNKYVRCVRDIRQ